MEFKISSALKSLIGKELITDEFVAVFELVKNSFDANAQNVKIIFEDSKIIIVDDGKGMDESDLRNKWLFVAYSAKRDGTEDNNDESFQTDYRDKINQKRIFAGAKGVGRFSCDRLGSFLNLITIKNKKSSKIENLIVDWSKFEVNPKKEFVAINVTHRVLASHPYEIKHGTILEISELRDEWDRTRIRKLRHHLGKLINPIPENDSSDFKIEIIAKNEIKKDEFDKKQMEKFSELSKKSVIKRGIINGYIENFVFESLGLNTTNIETEILADGSIIQTTLYDRGQLIYKLKEINPYPISHIKIKLFLLNSSAKANFKKIMGVRSVQYGSVFMYKNGFRIYPFGEEEDDGLSINRRKQQGYNRFLGTRDLIGTIMIYGDNPSFQETTSRDGGLIKNESFHNLLEFFNNKALKRLEKYAVDIIKWGDDFKDKETGVVSPALTPSDVKAEILEVIANLTNPKSIVGVEYDNNFLKIIETRQEKSVSSIAKNFLRIAEIAQSDELIQDAKIAERHLNELLATKNELEKNLDEKEDELRTKNKELQIKNKEIKLKKEEIEAKDKELTAEKETTAKFEKQLERNEEQLKIVTAISSQDLTTVTHLHHQVSLAADNINGLIAKFSKQYRLKGVMDSDLDLFLKNVSFENNKILSISNFGHRKIFGKFEIKKENDIVDFFSNYILKISDTSDHFNISFNPQPLNLKWITKFSDLDLSIIIDNMISNANKAGATKVDISASIYNSGLCVSFKNNGAILPENISDVSKIFEPGFSTTGTTGLGLAHVKEIIDKNKWEISVNQNFKKGVEFILLIK